MALSTGIGPALATLAAILERERRRGGETTPLDESSLDRLRELPARLRERAAGRANPRPAPVPVQARSAAPSPDAPSVPSTQPPPGPSQAEASSPPPSAREAPAATPPISGRFPLPQVPEAERTEDWRRQQLNAIFRALKQSPEPRALGSFCDTLVFAAGNPCADIVFVGEAPGAEEEKLRKPFVGPAGQKLDQILKAMGLGRDQVYISNVVKFRPKIGDGLFQGARNRPPTQEEMASCLPFLRAEIEVLRPRVIVALGRIAAEGLLERGGAIAAFRNEVHSFDSVPVVVTYHPSYLLRQESASTEEGLRAKRQVWEDMLRAMDLVGLPVSERQRRYFQ